MRVINAVNVNDAFIKGYNLLMAGGEKQNSRVGPVLVYPEPVTTTYLIPEQRVLFHSIRDANPVFHLMEALWMIAGRNDARWLDQFISDFSAHFAEDDGHQHGAYGFRWRQHFDLDGGDTHPMDQLEIIINILRQNPEDRRVVLTMWDPVADLGAIKRDIPCNTHIYLRIQKTHRLDMTVCCRSNDMWWGVYGANAVHFSILQEYLAARIGVSVGVYEQMSFNFHLYPAVLSGRDVVFEGNPYIIESIKSTKIVTVPEHFDGDLQWFMRGAHDAGYHNAFFPDIALPLLLAYRLWRDKRHEEAIDIVEAITPAQCDWRVATLGWMRRRMSKMREKEHAGP